MKLIEKIKSIKSSNFYIVILLGISLAIGIFYFKDLQELKKYKNDNEVTILKYKMSLQKIDSIINKNGELVIKQKVVITDDKKAINKISNELFNLKKKEEKHLQTIALLTSQLEVKIDSIFVPFLDTTQDLTGKDSSALIAYIQDSTIKVPKDIEYKDSTISLSQTILKQGVKINSIVIPDSLIQRLVINNNGLFKKDTYEFQTKHTSPLFNVKSQQSLIYVPKSKNILLKCLISFGVGIVTYKFLLK